jgi:hypothetical protein
MKTKYIDLIEQTFDFPQNEFALKEDNLLFQKNKPLENFKNIFINSGRKPSLMVNVIFRTNTYTNFYSRVCWKKSMKLI